MEPLLVLAVIAAGTGAPGSQEVTRAYFKQSGLQATLQEFERKEVPQEVRAAVGNVLLIARPLIEQKIVVRWSF